MVGPASAVVEPSNLSLRDGKADAQTFGLAEPACAFGLGDPVVQIAADLPDGAAEQGRCGEVGSGRSCVHAGNLCRGRDRGRAHGRRDLPPLEEAEELFPLCIGWVGTEFLTGTQCPAAGDEGP
ncbi:hypothetical protein [Streptomyces sp. NPDC055094]